MKYLILSLLLPTVIFASGVGVRPSTWEIVSKGEITQTFVVENTTAESLRYKFGSDNEVTFSPAEVVLIPQEEQVVTAMYTAEKNEQFEISLVAESLEQGSLGIASGVKIPVTVDLHNSHDFSSYYSLILILIGALALIVLLIFFKKVDK